MSNKRSTKSYARANGQSKLNIRCLVVIKKEIKRRMDMIDNKKITKTLYYRKGTTFKTQNFIIKISSLSYLAAKKITVLTTNRRTK